MEEKYQTVVEIFNNKLKDPEIAVPVAAISALAEMVEQTKVSTLHELDKELNMLIDTLTTKNEDFESKHGSIGTIALYTGCEMFKRFITRSFNDGDISNCIRDVKDRSVYFKQMSLNSRKTISLMGRQFIKDNSCILIHGISRVVMLMLKEAAKSKNISIYVVEGGPDNEGIQTANILAKYGIKTKVIPDSGVGYHIQTVDMVLLGAVAVVESGGIINKLGSLQIAILANVFKKPVYVAAESYKFSRIYPLNQIDLPENQNDLTNQNKYRNNNLSSLVDYHAPKCDYTPPQYITLLVTDLGILDPSSVGEELMKLYV